MSKRSPKERRPDASVDSIPEVVEYMGAEEALVHHLRKDPKFYAELCRLIEERNAKLENAEKAVKSAGVSCGPFALLSTAKEIDAEALFNELGSVNFQGVGGYTEQVTAYKVDRERFLAYVAANQIPEEVVNATVKTKTRYKKPSVCYLLS